MPVVLNLGCGVDVAAGWINIDRSPSVLLDRVPPVKHLLRWLGILAAGHMATWPRSVVRYDLRRGIPYGDRSVDAIYSSHMLEHMYLNQARDLLKECERVLKPGGIIRVALPDCGVVASDFVQQEAAGVADAGLQFNRSLVGGLLKAPSRRQRLVGLASSDQHRWYPTRSLVRQLLMEAKFVRVAERGFLEGDLPALVSVERREDSMFVEAATT